MRNTGVFKRLVEEGSTIRAETDVCWGTYYNAKKVFDTLWPDHVGKLKTINDWIYYLGGGWPNPTSKGRMEVALDTVGSSYLFLTMIGRGKMVEKHLQKFGIKISIDPRVVDELRFKMTGDHFTMIEKHWKLVFPKKQIPKTSEAVLKELINHCQDLQREICQLADQVKIDLASQAKSDCDVHKSNFMQVVSLKKLDKPKKEKRFNKAVERVRMERVQNLDEAMSIL